MQYKSFVNVALFVAFQSGINAQSDPLGLPTLTGISAAQVTQLVSDLGNYLDSEEPAIESFVTAAENALSTFPTSVIGGLGAQVTGFLGGIENIADQDSAKPTALITDIENYIESDAPAITAFANEVDSILSALPTSVANSLLNDLDGFAEGLLDIATSDLAAVPTANATVASGSLVTSTAAANRTVSPTGTISPSIAPFTGTAVTMVSARIQAMIAGIMAVIGITGVSIL